MGSTRRSRSATPSMTSAPAGVATSTRGAARQLVDQCGAHVPNFNMQGAQQHRIPFKSKSMYLTSKDIPEWTSTPFHRTRSELMQHRKAERIPHMSYDIDGDGVVGQKDYFIGKMFDEDHDDKLSKEERDKALNALRNGWLDKFHWGHDQAGAKRPFAVQQRRGRIYNTDNIDEIGETYPPHPNAHIVPKHFTQTELHHDRLGERKNAAFKLKENWDKKFPYRVDEQPSYQDNWVANPPITHIGQRGEADHQASRVSAGLLPHNTFVNPEREQKHPTLVFEDNPVFQTRCQLQETRKELMKRDLEEQRAKGEATYVPLTVRNAQREEAAYNFRRGTKDSFTKTKLEYNRKCDRIEYDMAHFGVREVELPRYADQEHPWWTLKNENRQLSDPSISQKATVVEPVISICNTEPRPKPVRETFEPTHIAEMPEVLPKEPGSQTVKRWTTDIIEHGSLRNVPRLFDTLRPSKTQNKDFAPLDNFSSFDTIRNQSLRQQAEARRRHAEAPPPKTRLELDASRVNQTREVARTGMSTTDVSQVSFGTRGARSRASSEQNRSRPPTVDATMLDRVDSAPGGFRRIRGNETLEVPGFTRTASMPTLSRTHQGTFGVRSGGFERIDQTAGVRSGGFERIDQTAAQQQRLTGGAATGGLA